MRMSMLVIGSFAALLLASCGRRNPVMRAPAGPRDPDLSVQAGGYPDKHFSGPVYVPRSSPMENGTTVYDVTYKDGVTVMSKKDTMQHLLSIPRNGSYVFDSSASQIAALKPGDVVLLSGLALCTVVEVKDTDTGYLLKTEPAKITDAIENGRLEGIYKIDFDRMRTIKSYSLADFDVDFGGYNYHVKFTPRNDRIDMQATIKFGGKPGRAGV